MPWPTTSTDPCVTEPVCRQPVDGINAFTVILLDALHPAVNIPAFNANASIYVENSDWMVEGQIIFIEDAGYYEVVTVTDTENVVVKNLGYTGNVNGVGQFTVAAGVSPGGVNGIDGADGADGADGTNGINGTNGSDGDSAFPTDAKGQLMVDTGALPHPHVVALNAGTDGQVPAYDATQTNGIIPVTIAPNAALDNAIARFNGTTGKPVPVQSSLLLVTDSGNLQISTGDAKGTNATDLQSERTASTRVASGTRSVICGGNNNMATGQDASIVGGNGNYATFQGASVGGGTGNLASGQDATVPGGFGCQALGANSIATGRFALTATNGQRSHSAGRFADLGDAQIVDNLLRNATADATPTELFLDGTGVLFVISDSQTWGLTGTVLGVKDDGTSSFWKFEGVIKRWPGVALVAAITPTLIAQDAGAAAWAVAVTADAGNLSLKIAVTGAAASNIRWHAHVLVNTVGWPP